MRRIAILVMLAVLTMIGCTPEQTGAETGDRLQVVASFYPIADFTERIGGEHVQVETLVGAGTDPHSWEMSTTDRTRVECADLFIYNGAGFEHWVDDLLTSLENQDLFVVESARYVTLREGHDHDAHDDDHDHDAHEDDDHDHDAHDDDHDHDAHDDDHDHDAHDDDHDHDAHDDDHDHDAHDGHSHGPNDAHTWISLRNAIVQMDTIKDALIEKDPENREDYERNFAEQKEQFEAMDRQAEELFADAVRTDFIVGHESFGYFAHDYGLTQHGIEGAASHGEPDPATMADLVRLAREKGIKTIFYDPLGSDKTAKAIAAEIGGTAAPLNPLEGRTADEESEGLGTLEIMQKNIEALQIALTEE